MDFDFIGNVDMEEDGEEPNNSTPGEQATEAVFDTALELDQTITNEVDAIVETKDSTKEWRERNTTSGGHSQEDMGD